MHQHRVWDLPVRICHWVLVLIIIFQYLSAEVLDDAWLSNPLQWHFYSGYTCIGILVFRLCWGLLGTYHAKFSHFLSKPSLALDYLRHKNTFNEFAGHNPAGAYSAVVLWSLLLTQAISGLFISDEIFNDGPYYGILGSVAQDIADYLHHNIFNLLLGFVILHILAILYYKFAHKESLTIAMITGKKTLKTNPPEIEPFPWSGLIISLLITALTMYLIIEVLPSEPVDDLYNY